MKITLLRHTPDPDGVVALAARLCYSGEGIDEIARRVAEGDTAAYIRKVMSLGHHSVLEHASFTFGVEGLSRAASHQLVRHRLASYSQKSQRYVVENEPFEFVVPPSVAGRPEAAERFRETMALLHERYAELLRQGVPPEDARFVLPNAAATQIVVTMNARELRHFFTLRTCLRAQWEIRSLAETMLTEARRVAPLLMTGAGPSCIEGDCPEGKMTCGEIVEVRERYHAGDLS